MFDEEFEHAKLPRIILRIFHDNMIWFGDQLVMIAYEIIHKLTNVRNTRINPTVEKQSKKLVEIKLGLI